jgi:hypothetical protein
MLFCGTAFFFVLLKIQDTEGTEEMQELHRVLYKNKGCLCGTAFAGVYKPTKLTYFSLPM